MSTSYVVSVYLADKSWGGAEEGGWWFDCGEHIKTIKVFHNEDRAWQWAHRMQRLLDRTVNKGRRPISSVISQGWYTSMVHEGIPPKHYPDVRPHYE